MSYADKHRKRSTSPVLRTTSEDRKQLYQNKDNYILYLEQQLEKATTQVHRKYEDRMKNVEDILQEHDEKFENFVKLIKLLQHFAESQESENNNIRNHVNSSIESLYHTEIKQIKTQIHNVEQSVFEILQTSFREQPIIQEMEQALNKKIDIIMDELRQTVVKTDIQQIENRLCKLEKMENNGDTFRNDNQYIQQQTQKQIQELKNYIDNLLKDQDQLNQQVQKMKTEYTKSSTATLPTRPLQSRQEYPRESQQSDYEILKPMKESKLRQSNMTKSNLSKSKSKSKDRSLSRQAKIEKLKQSKSDKVKEIIKKTKQVTPRKKHN